MKNKQKKKKLNLLSQKVWDNFYIALFRQKSFEDVRKIASFRMGIISLFLITLIMIFPTEDISWKIQILLRNFGVVAVGLLLVNVITFFGMKFLGSKVGFKEFFFTVNLAVLMSLIVVTIPAALISYALLISIVKNDIIARLLFSVIPFYNYLVYGWAVESVAKLKGIKSIIVALVALSLILLFNILLQFFIV